MKFYLLALLLFCSALSSFAQTTQADTLQFNKRVSRSVDQWVVFPKNNLGSYAYGVVYVDAMAGFTFHLAGNFNIDANGSYVVDTAMRTKLKYNLYNVRLGPNTKLVSAVPKTHYAELNVIPYPNWLHIYNNYTDTLSHNVTIGRHLNSMNDCEYALTFLLKTYKVKPHAPGVEFELAYAYNVLHKYDEAIAVAEPALKNDSKDIFLYKELGFSYLEKKDIDKAIAVFKDGVEACGDTHPTEKAEMAMNIGAGYRYLKNDDLYKEWESKAKGWAPVNSNEYKKLVQMGF